MNIKVNIDSGKARLAMSGRFDFSSRADFKRACEDAFGGAAVAEVVVDVRDLEYLDSSALGMLLLLNDKGKAAGKAVSLTAKPGLVCDVLRVASFDKLFNLQMA
jgi:anti-anti-sigma factor